MSYAHTFIVWQYIIGCFSYNGMIVLISYGFTTMVCFLNRMFCESYVFFTVWIKIIVCDHTAKNRMFAYGLTYVSYVYPYGIRLFSYIVCFHTIIVCFHTIIYISVPFTVWSHTSESALASAPTLCSPGESVCACDVRASASILSSSLSLFRLPHAALRSKFHTLTISHTIHDFPSSCFVYF